MRNFEKHINVEEAMERLENLTFVYLKVVKGFKRKYKEVDEQLVELYNQKKYKKGRLLAHSVKGVTGNLGADDLTEQAIVLEALFEQEKEDMTKELEAFHIELMKVNEEIDPLIHILESSCDSK